MMVSLLIIVLMVACLFFAIVATIGWTLGGSFYGSPQDEPWIVRGFAAADFIFGVTAAYLIVNA